MFCGRSVWGYDLDTKWATRPKRKKRATIDDVAALAGVSIKTVSRVFNSEPNVRPATKEKVLQAANELDYRPNLSARRLASNRSFVIGLIYDNPQSDYIASIQEGSLEICRQQDYYLIIHLCRTEDPAFREEILNLHRQSMADGFILTQPVSEFEPLTTALYEGGVPFVRISQREMLGAPCISVDDMQAAFKMTEHLISLGHRRIGFIKGHPDHGSSYDRLEGYRKSLTKHGIPFDEGLLEQGLYDFESGYSSAVRLLDSSKNPTAIFASNDHMAMGVLTAAHERRVSIPEELSVCGFDDSYMTRYAWPPLTTLRQPIKEVARVAADVLLKCIRDQELKMKYLLHSELVCRASTGPCPS